MSPTSTDRITLTGSQRRELTRLIRAGRTEQRLVMRAAIVLAAADGQANARIAPVAGDLRGHRPQVAAPLVRGTGGGVAGRCETVRPSDRCSPRCRSPRSRRWPAHRRRTTGCRCRGGRARSWPRQAVDDGICRVDLAGDGAPVAVRGRAQTLAVPVVDLHHRSRLRRQGATGARPVRPDLGRETVGRRRVRDLRRREDLHPGPLPLPPHPARRASPARSGSTTTTTAAARWPTWPPTTCTAAKVFGRCEDTTGIAAFDRLVDQVMTREPYAGLRPIFGLRTPARIGAMTWSRRVSRAAMVRAAGGGTR